MSRQLYVLIVLLLCLVMTWIKVLFSHKIRPSYIQRCSSRSMRLPTPPYLIKDYEQVRGIMLTMESVNCKNKEEWGGIPVYIPVLGKYELRKAGNYSICMDEGIRPSNDKCKVYSFGIQNEWSFEESAEKYGCKVFAFDPSMETETYGYSEHIGFYPVGLSNFDGTVQDGWKKGWKMNRLPTLVRLLKHENQIIDILKVDVENDEHEAIPDIINSGVMDNVKQIIWEIHLFGNETLQKFYTTYWVLERAGFVKFHWEDWNHDSCIFNNTKGVPESYCFIFSHLNTKFLHG